ncbi:MAG: PaaI family thioesterase [Hyphomonadaceae bacterium]|nr:PaaI family thioesterase [Hyphomonadaceae bacterium]
MSADGATPTGPIVIADGPFAGWTTWSNGADPYESTIGPFFFRVTEGRALCAFEPKSHHLNGGGTIHGGCLMSFADFALFAIAHNALRGAHAVTATCNSEFLSAGNLDSIIEARGEVLRDTRSLVFVRGLITQASRPVLAFSGTLKKIAV